MIGTPHSNDISGVYVRIHIEVESPVMVDWSTHVEIEWDSYVSSHMSRVNSPCNKSNDVIRHMMPIGVHVSKSTSSLDTNGI